MAYADFSKHAALWIRERNIKCYNASAGSAVGLHCDVHGRTVLNGKLIDTITDIVDVDGMVSKLRACRDIAELDTNIKLAYLDKLAAFWHTMWQPDLGRCFG